MGTQPTSLGPNAILKLFRFENIGITLTEVQNMPTSNKIRNTRHNQVKAESRQLPEYISFCAEHWLQSPVKTVKVNK